MSTNRNAAAPAGPFVRASGAVVQIARWEPGGEPLHSPERTPPARGGPDVLRRFPLIRSVIARALLAAVLVGTLASFAAAGPAKPAAGGAATAPKSELTLLYGDNHAFGIVVPEGWSVDDTSGLGSKLRVVLYPKGQSWTSAPTVMYVSSIHPPKGVRRTLRQTIEGDLQQFARKAPKGRVSSQPAIPTAGASAAEVRFFAPDGARATEAVAYVPEENVTVLLCLSSRDADGFERALPAFRALVRGYRFVAADLQTPR